MLIPDLYKNKLEHTKNPDEAFQNSCELSSIGDLKAAKEWFDFGRWWLENPNAKQIEITIGVSNG